MHLLWGPAHSHARAQSCYALCLLFHFVLADSSPRFLLTRFLVSFNALQCLPPHPSRHSAVQLLMRVVWQRACYVQNYVHPPHAWAAIGLQCFLGWYCDFVAWHSTDYGYPLLYLQHRMISGMCLLGRQPQQQYLSTRWGKHAQVLRSSGAYNMPCIRGTLYTIQFTKQCVVYHVV